ncbi:MAG: DUF4249 domain-containing protein [Bacteroidales bacterium]|nr:DUF4249 domain-containing protein [Bacteroidales bacterium]
MRYLLLIILCLSLILVAGCIIKFTPEIEEDNTLLVVEGMITDQNMTNKIRISHALPVGKVITPVPVKGCRVTITDRHGSIYNLKESSPGIYITDSTRFRGQVNNRYRLNIVDGGKSYESYTMEMKPVPPIDSIYYEKVLIGEDEFGVPIEECQVYLDTKDPFGKCLYYRWDFSETWEFILPYSVPNYRCWKSAYSGKIIIKNTSVYNQSRVDRFPIQYISNETERLKVKYSMLVNQYSLNEDEYAYWERVKSVSENVGGLYDVTPMSITGNVYRLDDPDVPVLGYFSVSAVARERIFIDDNFIGLPNYYSYCPGDTIRYPGPIPNLNISAWLIVDNSNGQPPYRVITYFRECADCTLRGTNVKPPYWDE